MSQESARPFGHFISAVIFFQVFPLLPLWLEYTHTKDVAMDSYILCASMYAFTTGVSSKKEWMLGICFLMGFLLAGSYKGKVIVSTSALPLASTGVTYCLLLVFGMHLVERWARHMNGSEPFFLFNLSNQQA